MGRYLDLSVQDGHMGVSTELAHIDQGRLDTEQSLASDDLQRCVCPEQYFAFEQANQALRTVELHIYRAGSIELQLTAIGQLHLAALASRAAVVGAERRDQVLLAQTPGRRATCAQNKQELERVASTAGFGRIQGCMSQRRRHPAQTLVDSLDMLPGPLMFAVGIQPLLPAGLLPWIERALLHFH